jgi:hypothetical protein
MAGKAESLKDIIAIVINDKK